MMIEIPRVSAAFITSRGIGMHERAREIQRFRGHRARSALRVFRSHPRASRLKINRVDGQARVNQRHGIAAEPAANIEYRRATAQH